MHTWLQTNSGKQVFPLDIRPEQIDIDDIAHALSQLCRFNGHTSRFYGVAEHSVRVSQAIKLLEGFQELTIDRQQILLRAALLHDASEAFLVDVPSPIKPHLTGYIELERRVQAVVARKFGLDPEDLEHPLVKKADAILAATEKRDLLGPEPAPWAVMPTPLDEKIIPWNPVTAKLLFLDRFDALFVQPPTLDRVVITG